MVKNNDVREAVGKWLAGGMEAETALLWLFWLALSDTERVVLELVKDNPGVTSKQIARKMGVSHVNANGVLSSLLRGGYILRREAWTDEDVRYFRYFFAVPGRLESRKLLEVT